MKDLVQHIKKYISDNNLIPDPTQPVIVGLSGGADSVALVHLLVTLGYNCIPAHCNFKLRGEESQRDEQFAREFARSMNLEFETIQFNTTEYAQEKKISIEMAARELRYQWFETIRKKHRAGCIAVGHQLGDTIETVLLNLIRGTGLKGLTGIKPKNDKIIRPLLEITREELIDYLNIHSLSYINDSSNSSNEYTRNKIRNQLIPVIQSINPSFQTTFQNTIQNLNNSYLFQQQTIEKIKQELVRTKGDHVYISLPALKSGGREQTVLYEILSEYNFNSTQLKNILQATDGISGKQFLAPGYCLIKDRNQLIISPRNDKSHLPLPEIIHTTYKRTIHTNITDDPSIVQLDADRVQFPLTLRQWKPGDYFYPLGLNRRKKISDFLIDLKIDRIQKNSTFVLTTNIEGKEQIIWVVGLRIDHRFRITDTTTTIVEIQLNEA